MNFKIGDTFYSYNKGIPGEKYKCYICDIVDDDMIVYKWYGKRKQCWHYEVSHFGIIESEIKLNKYWESKK